MRSQMREWLACAILGLTAGTSVAAPVGTVFTYQGQLKDGGSAPTGTYDLQFRLFDAALSPPGAQVGSTIQLDNVPVTNGLFTVSLDFGAQFNGDARWLDVGVHPGAQPLGNPYTILSPRQALTAAPYALGIRLPLAETVTTGSDAINVTNAGTGDCAQFNITDPANAGEAVEARTDGSGDAVQAINTGTGRAGYFQATNPDNNLSTLRVDTNSTNVAVAAIAGVNSGAGLAAHLQTGSDVLRIMGNSLNSDVTGLLDLLRINDTSTNSVWIGGGGGNVGIGGGDAAAPFTRLHVDGGSDASLTNDTSGYLLIGAANGANIVMDNNEIMARNNGAVTTLYLNHSGGQVRIGQGSGGTGRLLTPVLEITGGSDLSENFDISTAGDVSIQAGMVVCIDAANPGRLKPSTQAYDRSVAGVISGAGGVKTGMLMGQNGSIADGAHPVALTGRVYCLCDASNSVIQPGDLLTTSGTKGHAMKAVDSARSQGAVLGKAMTSLEEGQGLVLILVNLQ